MAGLKPCPFCGCEDIRIDTYINGTSIWCSSCYATISRRSYLQYDTLPDVKKFVEPEVIDDWNRRIENG